MNYKDMVIEMEVNGHIVWASEWAYVNGHTVWVIGNEKWLNVNWMLIKQCL